MRVEKFWTKARRSASLRGNQEVPMMVLRKEFPRAGVRRRGGRTVNSVRVPRPTRGGKLLPYSSRRCGEGLRGISENFFEIARAR
jgi:hypothetical protein